jgi:DNA-binding MarR family transcriptional regulator
MDDLTTYALLTTAFFFVALSFALLVRYRQVSQRINASTDLGRDLWASLEQRLKKQDERIIDVMARLDVVQARVMAAAVASAPPVPSPLPPVSPSSVPAEEHLGAATELGPIVQQPESQPSTQPPKPGLELDETQLAAIKLLGEGPKNTRQLTDSLKKSREHTARTMKELFDMGLVRRNDSAKPFVYQLTDEGKRHLPPA